MSLTSFNPDTAWYHQVGTRLAAHWRYKLVAGSMLTIGFNIGYFLLLYFPVFPVTEMPVTAFDRLVGFWSTALLVYMTLWIYISLSAWLLTDKRQLIAYIKALTGLALIGLSVFFFWPTSVPRPIIDLNEYPSFTMLVAIDEPRNVFPCLHAAFAVFSAIYLDKLLREMGARSLVRALNWFWCLSIMYSALATKQHLAVDLFVGAALGAAWAGLNMRFATSRQDAIGHQSGGQVCSEGIAPADRPAVEASISG